jgi:hypothetical protein
LKILFQLISILIVQSLYGQATNNVISVANANGVLKTNSIHSFSIGEPIISTISNAKKILTQGFLQPIGPYFLFANRDIIPCYTWKLWPNPANEIVNVSIDQKSCFTDNKIVFRIINANGDLLLSKDALEGTNVFNSSNWAPGTYFVQIINNTGVQSATKVIVMHQ